VGKGAKLIGYILENLERRIITKSPRKIPKHVKNHPGQMQFKPKVGDKILLKDDTSRGN
jgi:hypothetical protein